MKILVTNDDGILAEGLWILAKELKNVGHVVVVAPDREQSGVGTSVTLRHPLRIERVRSVVPDIEAYSVDGTPGDSVILALEKLVKGDIRLVVSGINWGHNMGNDVLISGTISGALQGYLHGVPAIAVAVDWAENPDYEVAASLAALLAEKILGQDIPDNFFLNVNVPDRPLSEIRGVRFSRLASESHLDMVDERHDGKKKYYWLTRHRVPDRIHEETTDIWAVDQGYVSITPLHIYQNSKASLMADSFFTASLGTDLFQKLKKKGGQ